MDFGSAHPPWNGIPQRPSFQGLTTKYLINNNSKIPHQTSCLCLHSKDYFNDGALFYLKSDIIHILPTHASIAWLSVNWPGAIPPAKTHSILCAKVKSLHRVPNASFHGRWTQAPPKPKTIHPKSHVLQISFPVVPHGVLPRNPS